MYRAPVVRLSRSAVAGTARRAYATTGPSSPTSPEITPKPAYSADTPPRADVKLPKSNPSGGGGNGMLIAAVLLAGAGGAYYYYKPDDAHAHAKKAEHEAKASAQAAKDHTQHAYDSSKAAVEARTAQAQQAARDAKAATDDKWRETKASAVQNYEATKNAIDHKAEQAKQAAVDAKENVQSTASSWWSWGSGKASEKKSEAAGKVEQGADKVKAEARKRE